jgi:hypothetical protein
MSNLKLVVMALASVAVADLALADATLTISDGVTSVGPITSGSGVVQSFTGSFDAAWSVVVVVGETKPALGTAASPSMDLTFELTSQPLSPPHYLTITFSDNNFGPTSTNMLAQLIGHVVGGTGSNITYKTFYDPLNRIGVPTVPISDSGSLTGPSYASSTGSRLNQALYSLTQIVTISGAPGGTSGASYSLDASLGGTSNLIPATVTLANLSQTYDGTAKHVSVNTAPGGLAVNVTYNGSIYAPTIVGNYTVIGTIIDPIYQGSATNTLSILKAAAAVTFGNLSQTYDGTARSVSVTTTPPGLPVNVTYNGSANAPTNAGSYTVIGIVNHPNYQGSATNTLVVRLPVITLDPTIRSDGTFHLSFTFTPGASVTVLTATNPALSLSEWTGLDGITEGPPGQFQFVDPAATSTPQRFYRVRSP